MQSKEKQCRDFFEGTIFQFQYLAGGFI